MSGQGFAPEFKDEAVRHASKLLEAKGEIRKLRAQLRRTEEERDISEKAPT